MSMLNNNSQREYLRERRRERKKGVLIGRVLQPLQEQRRNLISLAVICCETVRESPTDRLLKHTRCGDTILNPQRQTAVVAGDSAKEAGLVFSKASCVSAGL
jgi:hypothetical protein